MEFLSKEISNYSASFTQPESKLLKELNRETWAKVMSPRMLSGHVQGRILSMLSKMINPENIVDTFCENDTSWIESSDLVILFASLPSPDPTSKTIDFLKPIFPKSVSNIGDFTNVVDF